MNEPRMTYRFKWIVVALAIWELIFWTLYFVLLKLLGAEKSDYVDQILYKVPNALYLLLLLIPIAGAYLFSIYRHNAMVARTNPRVLSSYLRPVSTFSSFLRYFFLRNAFVLLVMALAQPIFGSKTIEATSESLELVICLDISNSMNTMDIEKHTSRLDVAKRALVELVNRLNGEKIGFCLFANNAFVHLPLTRDYPAAKLFIDEIETRMLSSQGTNIAQALNVSMEMFSEQKTTKGILLITDGENHEESPTKILAQMQANKVQFVILGLGTSEGGVIPKDPERPEIGYKSDATGKTIVSRINAGFLKGIAQKGGGTVHVSSSEFPDLSGLLTEINQMKRSKIDTLDFEVKKERYQVPLFGAFVCWLLYLLWSANYVGLLDRFVK